MTRDKFREARRQQRPMLLGWVTLAVPYVVEQFGAAGFDCVLLDRQHGVGGQIELVNCLTAARAGGLPALVRPVTADAGGIGQALDAGAQGVVCPLIETAADAAEVVRAVKYPPVGSRSWGPYAGKFVLDGEYFDEANSWTVACVQIETAGAVEALDDIMRVDGLDMVLVGPNDLAVALTGRRDIRAPTVTVAIDEILRKAREHDVLAAIYANDIDYARPLVQAGWDVIAVGTDMGMLGRAAEEVIKAFSG